MFPHGWSEAGLRRVLTPPHEMLLSGRPSGVAGPGRRWEPTEQGERERRELLREIRSTDPGRPHWTMVRGGCRQDEVAYMKHAKINIEKHQDDYVAYPVGIKGGWSAKAIRTRRPSPM